MVETSISTECARPLALRAGSNTPIYTPFTIELVQDTRVNHGLEETFHEFGPKTMLLMNITIVFISDI